MLPHDIIVDRCYLHGDPVLGGRRGVALNGKSLAVIDSYLADFKEVGADSQAVLGVNGPGPFKIVNNHLESAGENVMFGGGAPAIHDLVPSDIEIRHNYFFKPTSWRGVWAAVKNLFELKNARRVLVEGNIFENNWLASQALRTPPTQIIPRRRRFPVNCSFKVTSISRSRLACALAITKPTSVAMAPMSATWL